MTTRLPERYDPLRDELERLLRPGSWWGREAVPADGWSPQLDIEETDDNYVLHVEAPGVKPDDIDVQIEDDLLTIAGTRNFYDESDEEGFRRIERQFGRFHRAVRLPVDVDPDGVVADYADGMLTVTVPKTDRSRSHRIEVTGS